MLCSPDDENAPATDRMLRPYFGWYRWEWPDDDSVEFHLNHGDWIRLLRSHGFEVEEDIKAGVPATIALTGKDPGVYEVELHHPALTLLTVAVR